MDQYAHELKSPARRMSGSEATWIELPLIHSINFSMAFVLVLLQFPCHHHHKPPPPSVVIIIIIIIEGNMDTPDSGTRYTASNIYKTSDTCPCPSNMATQICKLQTVHSTVRQSLASHAVDPSYAERAGHASHSSHAPRLLPGDIES